MKADGVSRENDAAKTAGGTVPLGPHGRTGRGAAVHAPVERNKQFHFLCENMMEACAHCRMIYSGRKPVDFEILAVNPAFEKITGLMNVVGRVISDIIPNFARDNPDTLKVFGAVARTGKPARWEHYLAALDRWFDYSIYSPARGEFIAVFDNITTRKKAEEQLRLQGAALAAAADGIAIIGRDGGIIWVNKAFTKMTGYKLGDIRGMNPRVLKSGLQDRTFYEHLWSTILAGRVWRGQMVNRRKDGRLYHEEMTITPVKSAQGSVTHFIAIKQDISRRRKMERDMAAAVEREQERIGSDLHDGLCQVLTGVKFRTALLGQKLRGWAPMVAVGEAAEIESLLDQAIEQVRGISYGLNPVKDAPPGLMEALEDLATSVDGAAGPPRCRCDIPKPVHFHDRTASIHLYRIAQEAVQNAIRHGKPHNIIIELTRRANGLCLKITDDGNGLPPPEKFNQGMGMMNMCRRAGLIGASLEVRPAASRGTLVICQLHRPEFAGKDSS